jgi:hypothetical protein
MGAGVHAFLLTSANVAASLTNSALNMPGDTALLEFVMPWAGAIVGISVACENARTAGTCTVKPTINGTASASLQAQLDGTNTQYHYASQTKDSDQFAAGQRLGVKVTTDASWAAGTTPSVVAAVFVQRGLSET